MATTTREVVPTLITSEPQTALVYGLQWTAEQVRISRTIDLLIIPIVFFAVVAGFHIHFMLTVGDWDFWVDWKDRQFWVTATPVLAITFPAALQQLTWEKFRLPIGATLCAICLTFGVWMSRYFAFYLWSEFPMSLVWPATIIPCAIFLDMVLMLTTSWLLTSVIGGMGFALLFWPANWVMLAAYHPPVEIMGNLASVADYIGYTFTRTSTPEYLRFIERGTLRTFGGHSSAVSSFFAAFLCVMMYIVWWFFGKALSRVATLPNRMKKYMGL
jgi:methane/ammonia monooxygenase subunit A